VPATSYEYDGDGQLMSLSRPDGQVLTLNYGTVSGRLDSLTHPRGTEQFTYTSAASGGLLHSISSADSVTVTYGYDGPLMTSESWSGRVSGAVERHLDMAFRDSVVTLTVNGNSWPVSYSYDADGLPVGAGALSIQRRSSDGLISGTQLGLVASSQSYDEWGELSHLHYEVSGTGVFEQVLGRDLLGRIVSLEETAFGTDTLYGYRYDEAGRLSAVTTNGDTTARYWYDANGNRTAFVGRTAVDTATADYDAQDRLLRYGNTAYSYTAAGELLRAVSGADTTRYTYDVLGNLVRVVMASGDTINYVVDGLGRRVGRKVNGAWTRRWLYENELNVAAELDSTGTVAARYVYGTRGHVPDYAVRGDSVYRLVTDHLGSVRGVVNVATGTVEARTDYDPWGGVKEGTQPGFVCLGYAGGMRDTATGLVRFGARDYEPSTGRWTATDPIGFAGGSLNLYEYVASLPIDAADPAGLSLKALAWDWWTHYVPGVRGDIVGGTPDLWIGDLPFQGGTVKGRCRPPYVLWMRTPFNAIPLDVDVVVVCGHLYRIRGPVEIRGCTVTAYWPGAVVEVSRGGEDYKTSVERIGPEIMDTARKPCDCPR
jgi:RHS repeat-associated protein